MTPLTTTRPRPGGYGRLADQKLALLAGQGDASAAEAIHGRYADALLVYVRSIVRDPDDAQDALQQTMLNALQALSRRELEAPLRPWLFRIAHNTSVTLLRRRRPADELDHDTGNGRHGASAESELLAREQLRDLVDDVAALPERQRTALLLHDVAGLPHEVVASELACSPGASRQTLSAAHAALREAAAGREVPCVEVQRILRAGDRRRLRGRPLQAHLRTCAACRTLARPRSARRIRWPAAARARASSGAPASFAGRAPREREDRDSPPPEALRTATGYGRPVPAPPPSPDVARRRPSPSPGPGA